MHLYYLYSFFSSKTHYKKTKSYFFAVFALKLQTQETGITLDAQPQHSKHLLRQEDVSLLQMFSAGKSELASPITRAGKESAGTLSSFALGADTVVLLLLGWLCAQTNHPCQYVEFIIPGTVPGLSLGSLSFSEHH